MKQHVILCLRPNLKPRSRMDFLWEPAIKHFLLVLGRALPGSFVPGVLKLDFGLLSYRAIRISAY